MDKNSFINKSFCELSITSQEVEPQFISKKLGIEASSSYAKGDLFSSKHTGKVSKRFQNFWSHKSETIISEKEDLTSHITYFKRLFENRTDIFSELKKNPLYDISFWIWIETDNAGMGIDLSADELSIINEISNRVHISVITNRKVE